MDTSQPTPPKTTPHSAKNPAPIPAINMWAIVSELGFIIAVPLLVLLFIAIKVDAWLTTTPLFIIAAIFVSPILSGVAVWRKIKRLNSLAS